MFQVKGTPVILLHLSVQFIPGTSGSRLFLEPEFLMRMDFLNHLAIAHRKSGAKRRVTIDQRLECAPQRWDIHRGPDACGKRRVVGGAFRRALVQKPERLLAAG